VTVKLLLGTRSAPENSLGCYSFGTGREGAEVDEQQKGHHPLPDLPPQPWNA